MLLPPCAKQALFGVLQDPDGFFSSGNELSSEIADRVPLSAPEGNRQEHLQTLRAVESDLVRRFGRKETALIYVLPWPRALRRDPPKKMDIKRLMAVLAARRAISPVPSGMGAKRISIQEALAYLYIFHQWEVSHAWRWFWQKSKRGEDSFVQAFSAVLADFKKELRNWIFPCPEGNVRVDISKDEESEALFRCSQAFTLLYKTKGEENAGGKRLLWVLLDRGE